MSVSKWEPCEGGLIVTKDGVCAVCPQCGLPVQVTDLSGVDSCICGMMLKVSVMARLPYGQRGRPKAPTSA